MAFAAGTSKVVIIDKEIGGWGVKPATNSSTAKYVPRVTLDLALSRESFRSERMNSHGQIGEARSGTDDVSGTYSEELAAGSHTDIWAALLRGPWVAGETYTASTISASAVDNSLSDSANKFLIEGFKVGDVISISGFASPATANNKRASVRSVTAGKMVLDTALVTKAAGDSVTVAVPGKKLSIPSKVDERTDDSFTVEQYYADIGVSRVASGVKFGSASISMSPDSMATVEFAMMGKDMVSSGTRYFTAPSAATASSVMASNKASLIIDGQPEVLVTSLSLEINGGLEAGKTIGNLLPDNTRPAAAIFQGVIEVSGELTAYFEDDALFTKFRDDTDITLSVRFIGDNGKEFIVKLPRVRLGSASPDDTPTGGLSQSISFTALYNEAATPTSATEASSIVLQELLS